jgi:thiamine-monophosphate kinase
MLGEFELISRYFAPLAQNAPGALGLRDDAAVLAPASGADLVFTTDTIVAGVHFLPDDPAEGVARKLLRVNLSDLAAMGAEPLGYLLSFTASRTTGEGWIRAFAEGLQADQDRYAIALLGGDTTSTPGPTTLSLTAVGQVPRGRALRRGGAGAGDVVFVSGTIGDAALGLQVLLGQRSPPTAADQDALVDRYRHPRPRLALGQALLARGLATAAVDVSDGLVADLGHLCAESGLGAEVAAANVPLSAAAQRLVEADAACLTAALTGGDDYELLFTAPAAQASGLGALAAELDLPLTRIGTMGAGEGVVVRDAEGAAMALDSKGWQHF